MSQLAKPQFGKVADLVHGRSGFNVYVKVVSAETTQSKEGNHTFVKAVVADETGAANAFFKGDSAKLINKGAVIAIRNGRIRFIKNHISLEIDIFGRITSETVEIKENTTNNISDKEIEKKRYNRDGDDRRPKREDRDYDRKPREDRRPREEGERRPYRQNREEGDRRPRREEGERRPPREHREEGERRPYRQNREEGERKPYRDNRDNRGQNREGGDRRRQNDHPPRREPRREGEDERGERRPPTKFSKIGAIEPGDEGINFFAKVLSFEAVGKKARVVLGDETGTVKGFLFNGSGVLKEGVTIVLFKGEARVVKEHIEIQLMERGKIDIANREIKEVDKSIDISAKEWVEQA